MTSIAFAADSDFLDLDAGWPLLGASLEEIGIDCSVVAWDATDVDRSAFSCVAVNYAWGYITRRAEFVSWAHQIAVTTHVVNSPAVIAWNSDKTYLSDLAADGVRIVPTTFVAPGDLWSPPAPNYVVKPAISSGGLGAARYRDTHLAVAQSHAARLHACGHTVLVQPYQAMVDTRGETALVFIGGRFSHAAAKQALLEVDVGEVDRLWEREVIRPAAARADQLSSAVAAIKAVERRVGPTFYGRIDLVENASGAPLLLEAEFIEPSLFLPEDGRAAREMAGAIGRVLVDGPPH